MSEIVTGVVGSESFAGIVSMVDKNPGWAPVAKSPGRPGPCCLRMGHLGNGFRLRDRAFLIPLPFVSGMAVVVVMVGVLRVRMVRARVLCGSFSRAKT